MVLGHCSNKVNAFGVTHVIATVGLGARPSVGTKSLQSFGALNTTLLPAPPRAPSKRELHVITWFQLYGTALTSEPNTLLIEWVISSELELYDGDEIDALRFPRSNSCQDKYILFSDRINCGMCSSSRLGRSPSGNWKSAFKNSRYVELIRFCFHHKWIALLGAVSTVLCTPPLTAKMICKIILKWFFPAWYPAGFTHTHTCSPWNANPGR